MRLALTFALLCPVCWAGNLTLTVQSVDDHSITVRGADALGPRAASLEIRAAPDGTAIRTISGNSRVQGMSIPASGLAPATLYDFTFRVDGASAEAVALQQATTVFGYSADSVQRNLRHIAAQPMLFVRSLAASAEADPAAYGLMRSALRSAVLAARAEEQRLLEADLERRREEAGL